MKGIFIILIILTNVVLNEGIYQNPKSPFWVRIYDNKNAYFSIREREWADSFDCKIVYLSKNRFRLINDSKTLDTIVYKNKVKGFKKSKILFYGICKNCKRYKVSNIIYHKTFDGKTNHIIFNYKNRIYDYKIKNNYKRILIYIDIENAQLISNWLVHPDKSISPDIDNKYRNIKLFKK